MRPYSRIVDINWGPRTVTPYWEAMQHLTRGGNLWSRKAWRVLGVAATASVSACLSVLHVLEVKGSMPARDPG